jgi:hypothetical protein
METENKNSGIENEVIEASTEPEVKSSGDVENLLKTLEKERKARKEAESLAKQKSERERQLESELSKMKEIDPEKYWALVEDSKKREEENLLKKRQYEELRTRFQQEAQEAKQKEKEAYNRYNDLMVDTAVKEAFFSAGGRRPNVATDIEGDPTPLESVMSYIKPRLSVKDGRVVILDRSGNPELNKDGVPKSVGEKMMEFKKGTLGVFLLMIL